MMDWSLCDSKILLALHLTDTEQLTANPSAAPTQRFFSIKVCCTVAVLMFHRCVLSFISNSGQLPEKEDFLTLASVLLQ